MSNDNTPIKINTESQDAPWTFDEVITALRFISVPMEIPLNGFSIDSRSITQGQVFVAIKGEQFDGHDYLRKAYEKGAALALVENSDLEALNNHSYLTVPSTKTALLDLAQYARGRTAATIVGISGSVGKTTVRNWIAHLLAACGPTVSSPKNFNNALGLPLSMTNLVPSTKFGVFEIGIDRKDTMQALATLCNPHVAVLTSVGQAHLENFQSVEELAYEKGLLFSGLSCGGVALIDKTSFDRFPILNHLAQEYGATDIATVGFSSDANAYVIDSQYLPQTGETQVHACLYGKNVDYTIQAAGAHMVQNSLMALTATICSLYNDRFEAIMHTKWDEISNLLLSNMPNLTAMSGRGKAFKINLGGRKITLIDDAYNANLASMLAGIKVLEQHKNATRRIAVVGDMLALGEKTEIYHQQLFEALNQNTAVDKIYAVGNFTQPVFNRISTKKQGVWVESVDKLEPFLIQDLKDGDTVWIKGSNAIGLSQISEKLRQLDTSEENESIKKIA